MSEYAPRAVANHTRTNASRPLKRIASPPERSPSIEARPDHAGLQPRHTASDRALPAPAIAQLKHALNQSPNVARVTQLAAMLQPSVSAPRRGPSRPMARPSTKVAQLDRFVDALNSRIHLHLDIGTQDHLKIDGVRYNLMDGGGYSAERLATAKRALRKAPNVPDKVACQKELRQLG